MEPGSDGEQLQRQILQSTLQEVALRDDHASDCCVICLDVVSEPCEVQPCGHTNFDYICVSSWLFANPQCPLCKATVSKVLHGPPDDIQTTLFNQDKKEPVVSRPSSSRDPRNTRGRSFVGRRPRQRPSARGYEDAHHDVARQRREVYRRNLYSKHVGSNRMSRYRELTPQTFRTDEDLVSRARMWIRRELQVFSFLTLDEADADAAFTRPSDSSSTTASQLRRANNAEFLLEYIIAILKSVDTMGSAGQAEDMLSDFLGRDNTRLFLHELRAWLRSPYTKLEDWDRAVQYDETGESRNRGADIHTREATAAKDIIPRGRQIGSDLNSRRRGGDFYRPTRPSSDAHRRAERHEPYRRSRTARQGRTT